MLLALSDIDSCGDESDCECDELERESESGDEERIGGGLTVIVVLTVMVELTETW